MVLVSWIAYPGPRSEDKIAHESSGLLLRNRSCQRQAKPSGQPVVARFYLAYITCECDMRMAERNEASASRSLIFGVLLV